MKYISILISILYISTHCCNGYNSDDDEEDIFSYDLHRLYEEPKYELDPHDMLTPYRRNSQKIQVQDKPIDKNLEHCGKDAKNEIELNQKLSTCVDQNKDLNTKIQEYEDRLKVLLKRIDSENKIDMEAYYRRLLNHISLGLNMREVEQHISGDEKYVQHLRVKISLNDIDSFKSFHTQSTKLMEIDNFLESAFEIIPQSEESGSLFQKIVPFIWNAPDFLKNVDLWLQVLFIMFLSMGTWASWLFVKDIQKELKWWKMIVMMCALIFVISCLWHWRHLHKVAESRRHAKLSKMEFVDIGKECKPGQGSYLSWFTRILIGGKDACDEYFEEMMVSVEDEITPSMVISETLAKFFLQPLQHIGTESAKLISNFYEHIGVVYYVPATIFLFAMITLVFFFLFGYGIDFPFWLGGIGPRAPPPAVNNSDDEKLDSKMLEQFMKQQELFMERSKAVLTDIAQACIEHTSQQQVPVKPVMETSLHLLQSQLGALITQQFAPLSPERSQLMINESALSKKSSTSCDDVDAKRIEYSENTLLNHELQNKRVNCDMLSFNDSADISYCDIDSLSISKYNEKQEFVNQVKDVLETSLNDTDKDLNKSRFESPKSRVLSENNRSFSVHQCSPKGKKYLKTVNDILKS